MLGVLYPIDPVNKQITVVGRPDRRVSYQTGVVLLTTLSISKGVPPSGRMAVPQEFPGGRMFFTGAHAVATGPLVKSFEQNPNQLLDRALEIGGEMVQGADIAVRLPGLPYVPLYMLFWRGDPDFPGRAVIGMDDRAHFHNQHSMFISSSMDYYVIIIWPRSIKPTSKPPDSPSG